MNKSSKIFVSGHNGLVGSALVRQLQTEGYENIVVRSHNELDLTRQVDVEQFFIDERPEYVFHAAARAGGIFANINYPADFMYENLAIETNVIRCASQYGVIKLLFIATTSVYPKNAEQPVNESSLLTGELEPTNAAYGLAKIVGIKLCEYCNRQYGTEYISVTPTNLYGINDRYDPQMSHVIPALIRKFAEAVQNNSPQVEIWGDGKVYREFLFSDDLADACIFLMDNYNSSDPINVGTGSDQLIFEVVQMLREISGYKGEIVWDTSKPTGFFRRRTDCTKIDRLGWKPKISLEDGLRATYEDYLKNMELYRR